MATKEAESDGQLGLRFPLSEEQVEYCKSDSLLGSMFGSYDMSGLVSLGTVRSSVTKGSIAAKKSKLQSRRFESSRARRPKAEVAVKPEQVPKQVPDQVSELKQTEEQSEEEVESWELLEETTESIQWDISKVNDAVDSNSVEASATDTSLPCLLVNISRYAKFGYASGVVDAETDFKKVIRDEIIYDIQQHRSMKAFDLYCETFFEKKIFFHQNSMEDAKKYDSTIRSNFRDDEFVIISYPVNFLVNSYSEVATAQVWGDLMTMIDRKDNEKESSQPDNSFPSVHQPSHHATSVQTLFSWILRSSHGLSWKSNLFLELKQLVEREYILSLSRANVAERIDVLKQLHERTCEALEEYADSQVIRAKIEAKLDLIEVDLDQALAEQDEIVELDEAYFNSDELIEDFQLHISENCFTQVDYICAEIFKRFEVFREYNQSDDEFQQKLLSQHADLRAQWLQDFGALPRPHVDKSIIQLMNKEADKLDKEARKMKSASRRKPRGPNGLPLSFKPQSCFGKPPSKINIATELKQEANTPPELHSRIADSTNPNAANGAVDDEKVHVAVPVKSGKWSSIKKISNSTTLNSDYRNGLVQKSLPNDERSPSGKYTDKDIDDLVNWIEGAGVGAVDNSTSKTNKENAASVDTSSSTSAETESEMDIYDFFTQLSSGTINVTN